MSDIDKVKLKPVLGMEPGKYLFILYIFIIALVLFLLLFLPGIVKPGSIYNFDSVPSGAVVFVDGQYIGATPCEAFISEGEHKIRLEKEYYQGVESSINSKKRIFASLFAPKKSEFSANIVLEEPSSLLKDSFKEFAKWGMIDTYFDNYQPKPVIGPLFRDLQAAGYADLPALSGFLYSVLPFVHNEYLYNDFIDAAAVFQEMKTGEKPEVSDITESFTDFQFFKDSTAFFENLPFWFYSLVSDEHRQADSLSWYPALQEEYGGFLRDFNNDSPSAKSAVMINGMRFIMLSGGEFLIGADGNSFPYPVKVDDFMIMDREVTNDLYRLFISENIKWSYQNIDGLIEQGVVNQDYLKDFDISEGSEPVNFVSWFAAEAFCSWLQDKLPSNLADYTVRLPDEHEWEWAAQTENLKNGVFNETTNKGPLAVDGRMPDNIGLYDLRGNLWEWCSNWYAPAAPLITSRNPAYNYSYYGNYDGVERSVRGGCWANENSISISARGSQPPEWCTEFLGFRPIIIKEKPEEN